MRSHLIGRVHFSTNENFSLTGYTGLTCSCRQVRQNPAFIWPHRLRLARIGAFHAPERGSTPRGVTKSPENQGQALTWIF